MLFERISKCNVISKIMVAYKELFLKSVSSFLA